MNQTVMKNILAIIIEHKKKELQIKQKSGSNFFNALNNKNKDIAIIAEIKCDSPSAGKLIDINRIEFIVKSYNAARVAGISVVTDKKYFNGDISLISKIKQLIDIPILQKDFVIDEYQVYEAKAYQADALLLIARIVDTNRLNHLVRLCFKLGIEPVVEVYDKRDLKKALQTTCRIIGVNARNLSNLKVDIDHACRLISLIPKDKIALGFSGITSKKDVEKYRASGARGILIGTSLLKAKDRRGFITALRLPRGGRMDSSGEARLNKTKVKICGIRTLQSALVAIHVGVDFLGFNFVPASSRYIDPDEAKKIITKIRGKTKIVGVFQNAEIFYVNKLSKKLKLDYVQLHGNENAEYIEQIEAKVIKKIHEMPSINDSVAFYLLDRKIQGKGKIVAVEKAVMIAKKIPIFLAGGLTSENISMAIEKVKPYAVDVASGIETNGEIDQQKVTHFIKNVKEAVI